MQNSNNTGFRVVRFVYDKELNQVNPKIYATKEDARNAGNSWKNDCTVDQNIRKGRWFEIVEA